MVPAHSRSASSVELGEAARSVLVVEDDPALRAFMGRLLADAGHKVEVAGCIDDAISRLAGESPDLVLCDKNLPDGSGLKLIELTSSRGIPTIVLTGYASVDSAVEALRLGATDFLTKPVDVHTLIDCVNSALGRKPRPRNEQHSSTITRLRGELKSERDRARGFQEQLAQRTQELDELRTEQAASQSRGREAGSHLSHDLRSSLAAIKNSCEILQQSDPPKPQEFLSVITEEADRSLRLLTDLRELERIESDAQPWEIGPVVMEDVIQRAVLSRSDSCGLKQLEIETDLDPELGLVIGDADKLMWAVSCVFENAINYSPARGRVSVRLRRASKTSRPERYPDPSRGYAEVVIEDEGPGIKDSVRETAFERFSQGTRAKDPVCPQGSGLGLSVVMSVVKRLSGSAWIARQGSGASVGFCVPLM